MLSNDYSMFSVLCTFGKRAGWFARFIEFSRLIEDACVAIFVVVHVCVCVCVTFSAVKLSSCVLIKYTFDTCIWDL